VQELYKPITAKEVISSLVSLTNFSAIVPTAPLSMLYVGAAPARRTDEQLAVAIAPAHSIGNQRTDHHWCDPWSWVNHWQAATRTVRWSHWSSKSLQSRLSAICGVLFQRNIRLWSLDDLQTAEVNRELMLDEQTHYLFWLEPIEIMKCIQRIHWY